MYMDILWIHLNLDTLPILQNRGECGIHRYTRPLRSCVFRITLMVLGPRTYQYRGLWTGSRKCDPCSLDVVWRGNSARMSTVDIEHCVGGSTTARQRFLND